MSENLGLTSHKSSCNCTGCGMLRAGVCINCAEKTAALILESAPRRARRRAVLGRLPRGDRTVLLHPARALARAAHAMSAARSPSSSALSSLVGGDSRLALAPDGLGLPLQHPL